MPVINEKISNTQIKSKICETIFSFNVIRILVDNPDGWNQ
jgi:hypothetical protein